VWQYRQSDPVAGDVALVAELNRLFAGDPRGRDPRRAIDLGDEGQGEPRRRIRREMLRREIVFALR